MRVCPATTTPEGEVECLGKDCPWVKDGGPAPRPDCAEHLAKAFEREKLRKIVEARWAIENKIEARGKK
jgi:hypothetical protein